MLESLWEQISFMQRKFMEDNVRIHVLALDKGTAQAAKDPYEVLAPDDVPVDKRVVSIFEKGSWKEYCWAMEVAWVLHALEHSQTDDLIVYCDADLFFFSDPMPYITTGFRGDIGLTPHHFPNDSKDRENRVGRYNFGFGVFKCCPAVINFVRGWLGYAVENYSELAASHQRYLDRAEVATVFKLEKLYRGLNVGPWQAFSSVEALNPETGIGMPLIRPMGDSQLIKLICYHFHEFRLHSPDIEQFRCSNPVDLNGRLWNRTHYHIHPSSIPTIYEVYERALTKWLKALA